MQRNPPNPWRNLLNRPWRGLLNPAYPSSPVWRTRIRLRKKLSNFKAQKRPTSPLHHPHLEEPIPPQQQGWPPHAQERSFIPAGKSLSLHRCVCGTYINTEYLAWIYITQDVNVKSFVGEWRGARQSSISIRTKNPSRDEA